MQDYDTQAVCKHRSILYWFDEQVALFFIDILLFKIFEIFEI